VDEIEKLIAKQIGRKKVILTGEIDDGFITYKANYYNVSESSVHGLKLETFFKHVASLKDTKKINKLVDCYHKHFIGA
jgi:hypothetical protein